MNRLTLIALFFVSAALAAQKPVPSSPVPSAMPPPLPGGTTEMAPPSSPPKLTPPAPSFSPDMTPPAPTQSAAAPVGTPPDADVIPQAFPRGRYEESWKKNPFLLKTAPVAQPKESWAMDFALTSIAKMKGTHRISIKNKKTGESRRLTEGSTAENEFKIVSVNLQPDRKSSSVEIEKDGEKASLTYDATLMTPQPRGAVPGQPGMARPGMPIIPGQPGGNIPLPNARTSSVGGQMGGPPGMMAGPGGNFQRPQSASGGYAGNPGAGYAGGRAPGTTNATTSGTPGAATSSRLGALGPRSVAAGGAQNSLVPGTTTAGTTTVQSDPGNVVINTTDTPGTTTGPDGTITTPETPNTNTGNTTPVTRRRTLIPAPVVTQ